MELLSVNVGKGLVVLQYLAQNRSVRQKAVKDESLAFMYNWLKKESKLSFKSFLAKFLDTLMIMIR